MKTTIMLTIPGYIIAEQLYESERSLVFRGHRKSDEQPVILKLLRHEYPTREEIARFKREYELTRNLDIDGVVKVYALEQHKHSLVAILEDFGGESLTKLLPHPHQPLTLTEFLHLAIQIADILGAIHQEHIIHKDINPSNIIWNPHPDSPGQVKIIDFGIATQLSREQPEIRNPDIMEGTLAYMSPEQTGRMNRAIDYRTDLYSLGATYYHLLTGQVPFQTTDPMELVHCHLAKMPVSPCDIVGAHRDAPSERAVREPPLQIVSDIIMKLLAKNAEDRYQSAFGLKADLQKCLDQLNSTGTIETFDIGQQDISDRFQISQRLYGREQELETLLAMFDRVSQGTTELVCVTGQAGIGKSALVHEIHRPITEKRGYFIAGKYDQFTRNIPYSALIQAFQLLIRQLLTESEDHVALWKERLLNALGTNGQVIIDIIPEIELIIGVQPDLPELPPDKTQNRFHLTFQNFVQTFATAEHPLVIFLDNIQWSDSPSLKLIERFTTEIITPYMLMICTYRNSEVNDPHPLLIMLDNIQKAGTTVNTITLKPLALEHVNQLLVDTLHITHPSPSQEGNLLAELLLQKTGGNPFFLTQFLQSLYEEGLVQFNANIGIWEWDLEAIRKTAITDNVVELMADKIQKLPEAAQHALKLAACIGNYFDLEILSVLNERTPPETITDFWSALQEGLIVPLDESYKYLDTGYSMLDTGIEQSVISDQQSAASIQRSAISGQHPASNIQYPAPSFKFLHTRIQQAAYALIAEEAKQAVHLNIARFLFKTIPETRRDERIFEIINHFNIGRNQVTSLPEREELAKLNLTAGKKAKASAAYQPAYQYLQYGINLLGEAYPDSDRRESWKQLYDLTLALFSEAAEAAYLSGNYEQMEQLVSTVLEEAHTLLDKTRAYEIRIQAQISQNKLLEAVQTAVRILRLFGVHFPEKPGRLKILLNLIKTKLTLTGKHIEDLNKLPEMRDSHRLATMGIIAITGSPAYFALPDLVPLIVFKGIDFSVKYGNTSFSAFAYAGYGLMLCGVMGDIETGYQFGKLALSVLERLDANEQKAKIFHVVYTCVRHWKEHYKEALQPLLEGYQSGLETGDIEFGCYTTATYCYLSFFTGKELTTLEQEIAKFVNSVRQLKQEVPLNCLKIYHQTVLYLLEHTKDTDKSQEEKQWLQSLLDADDRHAVFQFYFTKLLLCYLFQAYLHAMEYADLAEQYLDGAVGIPCVPLYYFYDSLTRLAIYPDAPKSQCKHLLKRVAANQRKMKKWARHAPMNHLHRWYLVEAEWARVLGNDAEAIAHYDKAIELAREHEYLSDEALASELAADFYFAKGRRKLTQVYIRDARYAYLKWGATTKVQDIDQRYPKLAAVQRRRTDRPHPGTMTSTSTDGTNSHLLELSTVMKASQAISGEIVLKKLLKQLMAIVIENAGAQKGFLLLKKAGKLFIEAAISGIENIDLTKGQQPSQGSLMIESIPVEASQDLSIAIVNYVARTQKHVVLSDASREGIFSSDSYIIAHQPKSVLCVPLIKQGKLTGILYLENNLTTNAFTPDRLEMLRLLSAQAAISLENATIYQELEELNKTLEEKVKERTQKLNQSLEEVENANKKIMDSIQYAKLIQGSLLPNPNEIKQRLPESFFIWQPRDIVGGDIYFTEFFEDSYLVAVMDCTGHGIPGAFMTMIASSGMKRIIRDEGCRDPGQILKRLNFVVKTLLKQDTAHALSDDGLDAAVCLVKPQEKLLIFAGARLPLLHTFQGEVKEIKGDRHSIGYRRSDLHFTFNNHLVTIREGMAFYLLTDGFTDQLGGERGRSLGKKRFKQLLRKYAGAPFETQQECLLQAFIEYKGDRERLDDVTVVGFALNG